MLLLFYFSSLFFPFFVLLKKDLAQVFEATDKKLPPLLRMTKIVCNNTETVMNLHRLVSHRCPYIFSFFYILQFSLYFLGLSLFLLLSRFLLSNGLGYSDYKIRVYLFPVSFLQFDCWCSSTIGFDFDFSLKKTTPALINYAVVKMRFNQLVFNRNA